MAKVNLAEIITKDKIPLSGIVLHPKGRRKNAVIWVHGLSSAFYHGQPFIRELSKACIRNGIGYFKFNNRGHDVVATSPNGL